MEPWLPAPGAMERLSSGSRSGSSAERCQGLRPKMERLRGCGVGPPPGLLRPPCCERALQVHGQAAELSEFEGFKYRNKPRPNPETCKIPFKKKKQ